VLRVESFVEGDPDMPSVAPPVAAVPHGRPLAPTRPVLLPGVVVLPCIPGLGPVGLVGEVVVLVAPPVAPVTAPDEPPPMPLLLCAKARPVLERKTTVASKANRCFVCGMF
jgi:hypothetical protein